MMLFHQPFRPDPHLERAVKALMARRRNIRFAERTRAFAAAFGGVIIRTADGREYAEFRRDTMRRPLDMN